MLILTVLQRIQIDGQLEDIWKQLTSNICFQIVGIRLRPLDAVGTGSSRTTGELDWLCLRLGALGAQRGEGRQLPGLPGRQNELGEFLKWGYPQSSSMKYLHFNRIFP